VFPTTRYGDAGDFNVISGGVSALGQLATYDSANNNPHNAFQDVGASFRIMKQIGWKSDMNQLECALQCNAWTVYAWAATLNEHLDDPKMIMEAHDALGEMPPLPTVYDALAGETPNIVDRFQKVIDSPDRFHGSVKKGVNPGNVSESVEWRKVGAQLLEDWKKMLVTLRKNPADYSAVKATVSAEVAHIQLGGQAQYLIGKDLSTYPEMCDTWATNVASQRLAKLSLALVEHRAKFGSLPEKLPEVGPDGIDPFTTKPLLYKREGAHFIVYSVGPNLKDDGAPEVRMGSSTKRIMVMAQYKDISIRM